MANILVVDDDQGMREFMEIMLSREGYRVVVAANAAKAWELCRQEKFDLVITDLKMPGVDGIGFLKGLKDISPETMAILITAYASRETALTAMKAGAYDYIEKGFDIEEIKVTIRNALAKKGIRKGDVLFIKGLQDALCFGKMIGKSDGMLEVYSIIKKVANTNVNVLILGESGTGKELVAKALHENSARKHMPFVVINCGGIPENLLESELFGYMKGSFTGAYLDKAGLFEIACGGTIFLDEIAELPSALQVKLLRVVQEKTFRRIGGAEDIKVDTRIISATNKDLAQSVQEGTFREDLYYRLNVIPLHIPPLRQRKEDIPLLAKHLMEKYSREFGKEIKQISAYALELLLDYEFPGNIRELENIIERSIVLEQSNIILPENMVLSGGVRARGCIKEEFDIPPEGIDLNEEMAHMERQLIEKALEKSGWAKTKAAELLRVSSDSLRYRIEKLGIAETKVAGFDTCT